MPNTALWQTRPERLAILTLALRREKLIMKTFYLFVMISPQKTFFSGQIPPLLVALISLLAPNGVLLGQDVRLHEASFEAEMRWLEYRILLSHQLATGDAPPKAAKNAVAIRDIALDRFLAVRRLRDHSQPGDRLFWTRRDKITGMDLYGLGIWRGQTLVAFDAEYASDARIFYKNQ